jgi:hypothetical protein
MKAGRESHRWPNTDSVGARHSAYSDHLQVGGNGPAGRHADHQNERTFSDEIRPGAIRLAPYHTPNSGGRALNQVVAPIYAWKAFCSSWIRECEGVAMKQ